MREYVECRECGFVLTAANAGDAEPLHWDSCPDCDGTEFVSLSG